MSVDSLIWWREWQNKQNSTGARAFSELVLIKVFWEKLFSKWLLQWLSQEEPFQPWHEITEKFFRTKSFLRTIFKMWYSRAQNKKVRMKRSLDSTRPILTFTKVRRFVFTGSLLLKRYRKKDLFLRRIVTLISTLFRLNLRTKMQLALRKRKSSSKKGPKELPMKWQKLTSMISQLVCLLSVKSLTMKMKVISRFIGHAESLRWQQESLRVSFVITWEACVYKTCQGSGSCKCSSII